VWVYVKSCVYIYVYIVKHNCVCDGVVVEVVAIAKNFFIDNMVYVLFFLICLSRCLLSVCVMYLIWSIV
jgi:hypothetical protein